MHGSDVVLFRLQHRIGSGGECLAFLDLDMLDVEVFSDDTDAFWSEGHSRRFAAVFFVLVGVDNAIVALLL